MSHAPDADLVPLDEIVKRLNEVSSHPVTSEQLRQEGRDKRWVELRGMNMPLFTASRRWYAHEEDVQLAVQDVATWSERERQRDADFHALIEPMEPAAGTCLVRPTRATPGRTSKGNDKLVIRLHALDGRHHGAMFRHHLVLTKASAWAWLPRLRALGVTDDFLRGNPSLREVCAVITENTAEMRLSYKPSDYYDWPSVEVTSLHRSDQS